MNNQEFEHMIMEDFSGHRVTISEASDHLGPFTTVEWKNSKHFNYRVCAMFRGGLLLVWGDCGSATYGRHDDWLPWFKGPSRDLRYFAEKCQASADEKGFEWCSDTAEAEIRRRVRECIEELRLQIIKRECGLNDLNKRLEDIELIDDNEFEEAAATAQNASMFGAEHGFDELYLVGRIVSSDVRRHFYGLKAALAQR